LPITKSPNKQILPGTQVRSPQDEIATGGFRHIGQAAETRINMVVEIRL